MTGAEGLVVALEEYYLTNQTCQGAENLLGVPGKGQGMGHGDHGMVTGMGHSSGSMMMNQRLLLADEHTNILVDSINSAAGGRLTDDKLKQALPLLVNGQPVGYLLPEGGMGFSRNDETALVSRLNQAAITSGLIAVGASLLLAWLFAYRLSHPVRELTGASNKLAQGDLTQPVPVHGDDELAVLSRSFNLMATSLQEADESRRAITVDMAHELRNPFAVQRANLEALQDGVYPLAPENLSTALEQNYLLTRLVEDLRPLALADSGQLILERTLKDLPALVRRLVDRFEPQADYQSIKLSVSPPDNCPLSPLDPGRLVKY